LLNSPSLSGQDGESLRELRKLPPAWPVVPAGLPSIPGGWTEQTWVIDQRALRLMVPACPDDFLDDQAVHALHEQTGYMPYWAYLWPAAITLAELVVRQNWPKGTRALELGSGLGLVGLAAAATGLPVQITDYDPLAVELVRWNAHRLGISTASAELLDWTQPEQATAADLVLGCELLYEDRNHELLLNGLDRWLATDGVAWFGDGGRVRAQRFCRLLVDAGYRVQLKNERNEPMDDYHVGRFQLIEVRRRSTRHWM
jgi:predicted nicotinamide N-methyase